MLGRGGLHFLSPDFEFHFQRGNQPTQRLQEIDHNRRQLRRRGFPHFLLPPFALNVLAVIQGVAASLRGQALLLALETFPLPRDAALLLLLRRGHPDHTERIVIAVDVAVQVQCQLFGIPFVGLDLLVVFIPVARPHDVIGGSHLFELPVQAVAKGTRLVAGEHFFSQRQLLSNPQHKLRRPEALRWLRRAAINEPYDHVAVQVYVDSQFDRLGFRLR